jgi:RNA polymerase sigma-70 factor (ECF subfamily)
VQIATCDMSTDDLADRLEQHRGALLAHCRRTLGSGSEADDAVQETMVRAWRSYDGLVARSSLRSWLFRIATNVCFDMLKARQRRARPIDATAEMTGVGSLPATVDGGTPDPADRAVEREDVRLAFVAALLHLPPKQRSVLLLCEVLRWPAAEVAELLGTSVASVNSALQRARATLAEHHGQPPAAGGSGPGSGSGEAARRLAEAFERYDLSAFVALLR